MPRCFLPIVTIAAFCFLSCQAFAQQVGVVNGEIYYTANADLNNGDVLQLVDWNDDSLHCCATIIGKKLKNNSPNIFDSLRDKDIIEYSISVPKKAPKYIDGFGVVGNAF